MELRHLRYFIAVAEALNFTRAARLMGVAQPPLSVQVRKLEEELGSALFDRSARRVTLTPAGAAFLPKARRIVATADEAVQTLQDEVAGRAGQLRLAVEPWMLSERLAKRIRKFVRKHRGLRLFIEPLDVQLDISSIPPDARILQTLQPSASALVLEKEAIGVAVPPKHRLMARESVGAEDLVGESVLVGSRPTAAERLVMYHLEPLGASFFASEDTPLARLGRASLGLGVVPCGSASRLFGEMVLIPFAGGQECLHTVLEVDPASRAPAVTAFIDFLRQ